MSEESILILNMLREGKITAEQADSLLRSVRESGSAPPPAAPPPNPASSDSMQARLVEIQGKIGAALAGKMLDHLSRPDLDMGRINKAVDDAMRGLNSLKNDALRTARTAARQASQEARKAAREGRRAFKFDLGLDFRPGYSEERPVNSVGQAEARETGQSVVTWAGADRLFLENKHGRIKVIGSRTAAAAAEATVTKTAWAGPESEARVLLQQIFLTHQVENGRCKIGIAAPQDAYDRLTVDYEITVPCGLPLEVATTFGEIAASGVSGALIAKSVSGPISVAQPWGEGVTQVTTVSGSVAISDWNLASSSLSVETGTGDVVAEGVTGESLQFSSRSGDVTARKLQAGSMASFESASGDVSVTDSSAGLRAHVRTQSGRTTVHGLRAVQVQVETVSGDARLHEVSGTLTVKTISGDIEASGMESPAVSLLTVSGDARWAFAIPFSGSFFGTTVSGDLHLALGASADARVEMNTTSGALSLAFPLTESVLTERHAAGKIGAGTGSLRLQSVSGDLTVDEAEKP